MISSLANFLMLILYHGAYPQRVAWTLLMFTLGAVGIARVAIERDRAYSLGYAGVLGILTFLAMAKFVDSPLFSAFILAAIAYLADVIVRDCTLIDESVDASGQGLIDSGRMFIKSQMQQPAGGQTNPEPTALAAGVEGGVNQPPRPEASAYGSTEKTDSSAQPAGGEQQSPAKAACGKKAHQPGRTIMYLALAALPLFGLGQFFLRGDAATWSRAQWLLAVYLFSALSLLVTTSFLGLRRYLRQRKVEMPGDVSVAWLGGGLAMIALVLMVAHLAPLPGSALASFELPDFLDSPSGLRASRFGWGDEGAEKSNPDAPSTTNDPNSADKEIEGVKAVEGAPEGAAGDGNRDEGPAGQQQGGKQQGGGGDGEQKQSSSSGSSSQQQNQSGQQSQQQNQSGQQSQQQGQSGQQSQQQSQSGQQSQQQNQSGQQSQTSSQQGSQSEGQQGESQSKDSSGESRGDNQSRQSGSESDSQSPAESGSESNQDQPSPESASEATNQDQKQDRQPRSNNRPAESAPPTDSSPPSSSGVTESIAGAMSMVASLIKFVIFAVLIGIVAAFLWLNRHLIAEFWALWFQRKEEKGDEDFEEFLVSVTEVPPRTFASFRNPIGKESDLRRIIVITFQAFEAWTREQGTPRGKDETPSEFIRRVARSAPNMSGPASQLVDAYNRIVYGRGDATDSDLNAAREVWQAMQASVVGSR